MVARLEKKHWLVIAALLTAVAGQLSGVEHGWLDAMTPRFVAALLLQIVTTVSALYIGAPRKGKFTRRTDEL